MGRWLLVGGALLALVLVPFYFWEASLTGLAERWTRGGGGGAALAIVVLLGLDIVLPIPSSLLSTAAGALLGWPAGAMASWLGMNIASAGGYWLGARSRGLTSRLVGAEELERAAELARRFGDGAIVVSRPVPVLAEASAVLAGLLQTPWMRFAGLSAGANLGVSLVYAYIGAYARQWDSFLLAFGGAMVIPAVGMWAARRWRS